MIGNAWAQSFCPRFDANENHTRHDWEHGPDDVRECPGLTISRVPSTSEGEGA
jgi:hypothetical protein